MEKILVAVDGKRGVWEALSHACSLAKRIAVKLNILLVVGPGIEKMSHNEREREKQIKVKLELLIEAAKAQGIQINYFITEGIYEDEVIHFVNHNKISLLVYDANDGDTRAANSDLVFLRSLRHRIACRVEVVSAKKIKNKKGEV
ncbi:MAG: universal stress protein [Pseudomonadota bacterium]